LLYGNLEETLRMNEMATNSGTQQLASLTTLQRELLDLAHHLEKKSRPPKEQPAVIRGPVLVIRGK
jgi:hypothetical protein